MDNYKDLDHLKTVTTGNTVRTFLREPRELTVKLKILIQKKSQRAWKTILVECN